MTPDELKKIRKKIKLTQSELGVEIGATLRTVQNWEGGINKIPGPVELAIKSLVERRENPNFLHEDQEIYINKSGNKFFKIDGEIVIEVPLLYFEAYARYLDELSEAKAFKAERTVAFVIDKLDTASNYLSFRIVGDSMAGGKMEDTPHKAVVLGKEIQKSEWLDGGIKEGSDYGWVILTNKNILFKDIISVDKSMGTITCHSRNPSPEYADFELSLNDVYQIFKVIKRAF